MPCTSTAQREGSQAKLACTTRRCCWTRRPSRSSDMLGALRGVAAGPALFDFDYRSFNENFRTASRAAGLSAVKPDLYQLRHGGPSHDILNRLRSKAEVKDRGRWRDDRSVRRYEAHGMLQLQERLVSEETQSRATRFLQNIEARLRSSMPRSTRFAPTSRAASSSNFIAAKRAFQTRLRGSGSAAQLGTRRTAMPLISLFLPTDVV